MSIQVRPSGSALGAEIVGADLTQPMDDATFAQIRAAFYEHEVVYFRGQALSDQDQIRFSARFGELRRLKLAIADGVMKADGQVIYAATDLRVGLFEAGEQPAAA